MNDRKKKLFEIIMERSNENETALKLLIEANCYALIGAIIRMELDSLVRLHEFNNSDHAKQEYLLDKFFSGYRWPNTDKNMVSTLSYSLPWAIHIYDFCCAFIHLSPYHDWAVTSNIPNLTKEKRLSIVSEIKKQQNDVWGYDTSLVINPDFEFDDLIPFVPYIYKKLKGNLLCELNNRT